MSLHHFLPLTCNRVVDGIIPLTFFFSICKLQWKYWIIIIITSSSKCLLSRSDSDEDCVSILNYYCYCLNFILFYQLSFNRLCSLPTDFWRGAIATKTSYRSCSFFNSLLIDYILFQRVLSLTTVFRS